MFFLPLLLLVLVPSLYSLPFNVIKKETDLSKPTLLVIGGIHGNEPGSYFAAAMLSQHYRITEGNLWIIPDLNRPSIQQNNRGINGDMNRKFAFIHPDDADIEAVQSVQKIITENRIGLILNLHDGHGFYRKEHLNTIFNPNAWGQTCVIDQGALDTEHPFGNLNKIAEKVSREINNALLEGHHVFDVRNTNTRFDDEAMKHSLTYFAVSRHKPAFAIETSKNLPSLPHKVFYQLHAIEAYMRLMGIQYERHFDLNLKEIDRLLKDYGTVTINNNFYLKLENLKNSLSFIPLQSESNVFEFQHPLGSIQKDKKGYNLFIGNQKVTSLTPSYHANESCKESATFIVDGQIKESKFAKDFLVTTDFKVVNKDLNKRVNVIGFTPKGVKDEANLNIRLKDLDPKYSIDTAHKSYRIEFYQKDRFCGMVLAHFK